MKTYWIAGIVFGILFVVLMTVRLDLLPHPGQHSAAGPIALPERDTWMNLFQEGQKIGFSHSVLKHDAPGYRLEESLRMRLNTMGLIHDVTLETASRLKPDLSFESFDFRMNSGRFQFKSKGMVSKGMLIIETEGAGGGQRIEIPIPARPHLASVLYDAVIAGGMKPGEMRTFDVFDISSMERVSVSVRIVGKEEIFLMGASRDVSRIILNYKGVAQSAWISEEGEVLREEGLLGMRLEKTDARDAVSGIASSPDRDLTLLVSVPVNTPINDPKTRARLALKIEGISMEGLDLDGGRQSISGDVLMIKKESLADLSGQPLDSMEAAPFLEETLFIQSNHETLVNLSRKIVMEQAHPLEKIKSLVAWMHANIEKKPVMSIPDALSVLKNRSGDCNEHAVLLAALARAAGVPAKVEAGLVYLEGRFYYHAWNLVHAGRWIAVDALFNEIPADVTHVRLITGAEKKQLDLLPVIGKIRISVLSDR